MSKVRRSLSRFALLIGGILLWCVSNQLPVSAELGDPDDTSLEGTLWNLENNRNAPSTPAELMMKFGRYERALVLLPKTEIYSNQTIFADYLVCSYLLGRYQNVLTACDGWVKAHPTEDPKTKSLIFECQGTCLVKLGQYQLAIQAFDQALKLDPTRVGSAEGRKQAALAKMQKPRPEKIKVGTTPEGWLLLPFRSSGVPVMEVKGGPTSASKSSLRPKVESLWKEAQALEDRGEFQRASDVYRKLAALEASSADVWASLGNCTVCEAIVSSESEPEKNNLLNAAAKNFDVASKLNKQDWRIANDQASAVYWRDKKAAIPLFERTSKMIGVPVAQKAMLEFVSTANRNDLQHYIDAHK